MCECVCVCVCVYVCVTAIRSEPYQTQVSLLFSQSFLHIFISWSKNPHTFISRVMYTYKHCRLIFHFDMSGWSFISGTSISLSWCFCLQHCLPGWDWENPKILRLDASFTVYRDVSTIISWRPSLEIQTNTLMRAL